jgi:hypothetical protein
MEQLYYHYIAKRPPVKGEFTEKVGLDPIEVNE